MRLYLCNNKQDLHIHRSSPLESSIWQALEIFEFLPEDDGSYIGLVDKDNEALQFTKYNKYVWLIEIPKPHLGGSYQGYFTKNRCVKIITEVFNGLPLSQVTGLSFEKYL